MNEPARRRGPWRLVLLIVLPLVLVVMAVLRYTHIEPWLASQTEQGVEKVLNDQVAAWNRGDLEGFMEGYWKSPELTFYSGSTVKNGWNETLQRYRQRYQGQEEDAKTLKTGEFQTEMLQRYKQKFLVPGKEMGQLTFRDLKIEMAGRDTAFVRGRWQLELSQETIGGLFTLVFKRLPEGWRIVHDHTS